MKKVNIIISWIIALIVIDALFSTFIAFSTNIFTDITKLVVEILNVILVIYLMFKIKLRDPMIYENKTISNLVFQKERSPKFQNIPVSILIMIVFTLLMLSTILPEALSAYLNYFK